MTKDWSTSSFTFKTKEESVDENMHSLNDQNCDDLVSFDYYEPIFISMSESDNENLEITFFNENFNDLFTNYINYEPF